MSSSLPFFLKMVRQLMRSSVHRLPLFACPITGIQNLLLNNFWRKTYGKF